MPDPIDPAPALTLSYASPKSTVTSPADTLKSVFAILFAISACGLGGIFLIACVHITIDALNLMVQSGGVVKVQSDTLGEGTLAEVVITTDMPANKVTASDPVTWDEFIGAGAGTGRSVEEIDASIREMRDEWL